MGWIELVATCSLIPSQRQIVSELTRQELEAVRRPIHESFKRTVAYGAKKLMDHAG